MRRTQIQVPGNAYRQIARIAREREWSISEVFRRAAELYVTECPQRDSESTWELPDAAPLGTERVPVALWRDVIADDEAGS